MGPEDPADLKASSIFTDYKHKHVSPRLSDLLFLPTGSKSIYRNVFFFISGGSSGEFLWFIPSRAKQTSVLKAAEMSLPVGLMTSSILCLSQLSGRTQVDVVEADQRTFNPRIDRQTAQNKLT